ncbi:IS110 family transposase [Brevibacterium sp. 91QC2O2]|uniref:IS110 family transposase n=1 Tax=Brevibacterium sp. 91QC2O2 TaxID=2968458 RepID=UPI00211BC888|nr:IS110 family transposase [Brevibacterium sp. 91QC2O2]MCQ9369452.1 IS110 family transposase [Brevibacterium sp. 91QC2O2]
MNGGMQIMRTDQTDPAAPDLVAGIDTHTDTHTLAILTGTGGIVSTETFPTGPIGYHHLIDALQRAGGVGLVGVEGTTSYGAGLTRALQTAGYEVREVLRPARRVRRLHGKSDPIDAIAAARTVLSGDGVSHVKDTTSPVESLRVLNAARSQLVHAATAMIVCIKSLLVTAPDEVRQAHAGMSNDRLAHRLAAARTRADLGDPAAAVVYSLKHLAKAYLAHREQADAYEVHLHAIVEASYPRLLDITGAGTISAAQLAITAGGNPDRIRNEAAFASLCGVAPIPASSGKTHRHRINHGGDRRGNHALHTIAMARMRHPDARTRAYIDKCLAAGKSKKDIRRCLKRAIAREVHHVLTRPDRGPAYTPGARLKEQRTARGLTMIQAAAALGVWPARISDIEHDRRPILRVRTAYEKWLETA